MTEAGAARHDIDVGEGGQARRIAVLNRAGRAPCVVWLGGFRSDMGGTKATALDAWGAGSGHGVLRFDYSGHGDSGGDFLDGTIGRWLEESDAAVAAFAGREPPVLVGSSMGGWIALLLALRMARRGAAPAGLVLIAPAIDMTDRLMDRNFPDDVRASLARDGVWHRPSAYGDGPYPITARLISEGRQHLLLDRPAISVGCPIHILHGREDPDVPLDLSLELVSALADDDVTLSVVHDGDHRLSRDEDIALLVRVVAEMAQGVHAPSPAA